jgi:penicillin amidase
MKRLFVRFVVVAVALSLIAAVSAYTLLVMSLPTIDGELEVAGIHSPVTIERDAAGIPVVTASNRIDLAFGTGYVHGQDRFFQMDLTRRNAAGELAELFGSMALPLDRRHRFHRFRARAEAIVAGLPDDQRAVLAAYADGVNAGVEDLGARPFEYLLTGSTPEPWVPADSLLAVFSMYLQLNDETAIRDVRRGLARQVLPPDVYAWLYQQGTQWDAPMMGDARKSLRYPDPESYDLTDMSGVSARIEADLDTEQLLPGSNNWAVSGELTGSGRAIVANDMHLGITTPNVFYRIRMRTTDTAGIDLSGVVLPGAPILVAGSNGHLAWGNTNSYGDWSDAVIIVPGQEAGTYRTPRGLRKFDVYDELIKVKGGEAEALRIRETIWGPVLEDDPDPERMFAVSWIGHVTDGVSLDHLRLETATSVEQALRIANEVEMPPQNFVVGDADGNIGWTIAGRIPVREGYDPMLPADWSESGGWTGWVAPGDYPRIVNPDSGRIWTANARVADGAALDIIGDGGYDLGARAQQIRDGLFAVDSFSPQDMLAIQLDDRAVFLSRWRDLLLETLDADDVTHHPDRAGYRELVEDWIPRAATASVGYRLVRAFRVEVRNRVFAMLMRPVFAKYGEDVELRMSNQFEGALWTLVNERPPHLLTRDYESWHELLVAAIDTNIEFYRENYDSGLEYRTWGERNTAAIRHPLSSAVPMLAEWLDMPADPLPGDSNLPRAQGPTFGASERFAVSPGDEDNGILHMPAGQSGHPLSDFYRIGHEDWVAGRPSPFQPGPAAHTLILVPAD